MKKIKALEQILKFIASGQIPQELYDKYLANTEIGFMRYEDLKEYFNIPKPRTEQEILKDFEKLGYEVVRNDDGWLEMEIKGTDVSFMVSKFDKSYDFVGDPITLQEHKLLNELFSLWGWI